MEETVFFVIGITLVVIAVVVSVIGLRYERFPGSRLTLVAGAALLVVMVAATTTSAVINAREEQRKHNEEAAEQEAGSIDPGAGPGIHRCRQRHERPRRSNSGAVRASGRWSR